MKPCVLPVPPYDVQNSIVLFLDRETAKIDALVAEQERLIELLKEKQQAVISQAVTKGLDLNVPMKDSGVEWLGSVPANWLLIRSSYLFRAGKGKNGQLLTREYCSDNEGEFPVYSGQSENVGVVGMLDRNEFDFGQQGVLFSTTVGAKAMHLRHLYGRFSLSQNCMIIWPTSDRCDVRFYYYHFAPLFKYQRELIPDHMQPSFRIEDLYSYLIALPPLPEQKSIASYLDKAVDELNSLAAEAECAIDLLKERRSALISAAVTGKIDVRNLAPAVQEAA